MLAVEGHSLGLRGIMCPEALAVREAARARPAPGAAAPRARDWGRCTRPL